MARRSHRRKPPPQDERRAEIVDLAHDGRGLARVDGKVVFIDGALPGERVRYMLSRVTREADEGRLLAVEVPSPDRVAPRCAHFGTCGGCVLQHLAPEAQVAFKQKQLLDALTRIGRVTPEEIAPPVTGPVWAYRRRARLGAKQVPKKGGLIVGFRERESPLLTPLASCEVLDARIGRKLEALAALIGGLSIAAQIPQVEIAAAESMALVLRVMAPPNDDDRARLAVFATAHGFDLYLQSGGTDSLAPVGPVRALRYAPEVGSEAQLEFGPLDFVQVNGELAQAMVAQALDWLEVKAGDRVLELFAGLGNFTLPLAARGAQVTAVEGEAGLVERGRANLARNGHEARFLRGDLFKPEAQLPWLRERYDLALIDPPRSGAAEILPHLAATRPRRLVYVSCHPGTLARDAGELVRTHGYRLSKAGVLDMFPHTAHIESMALFERD